MCCSPGAFTANMQKGVLTVLTWDFMVALITLLFLGPKLLKWSSVQATHFSPWLKATSLNPCSGFTRGFHCPLHCQNTAADKWAPVFLLEVTSLHSGLDTLHQPSLLTLDYNNICLLKQRAYMDIQCYKHCFPDIASWSYQF